MKFKKGDTVFWGAPPLDIKYKVLRRLSLNSMKALGLSETLYKTQFYQIAPINESLHDQTSYDKIFIAPEDELKLDLPSTRRNKISTILDKNKTKVWTKIQES